MRTRQEKTAINHRLIAVIHFLAEWTGKLANTPPCPAHSQKTVFSLMRKIFKVLYESVSLYMKT